jgi:hypothetical protein
MSKFYYARFGSGNPADNTGLTPTLTIFAINGVSAITAPGITETPAGSGLYRFEYGPTQSILWQMDGGAGLADSDRYIVGVLDPLQVTDQRVGVVTDSFGDTAVDPTTLMGFAKRNLEFQEGDASFNKNSGLWSIYARGGTELIREKTLTNTQTSVAKE